MKAVILFLSLFVVTTVSAQKRGIRDAATWTVILGKKTLLKATAEDEAANVVSIKRSDLKKKGNFTLRYNQEVDAAEGWNRAFMIMDERDNELKRVEGAGLTMSNAAFAKLVKGQSQVKIYTMATPSDPRKAAVVRVRRVHLVTINIK